MITSLQFLYNFVQENEQRKLLLWLDLFANSKVANEYSAGTFTPGLGRDPFAVKLEEDAARNRTEMAAENHAFERDCGFSEDPESDIGSKAGDDAGHEQVHCRSTESGGGLREEIDDITQSVNAMKQIHINEPSKESNEGEEAQETDVETQTLAPAIGQLTNELPQASAREELLYGNVKTESGDVFGALRTPQSAAITLQQAKDQLMARLADPETVPGATSENGHIAPSFVEGTLNDQGQSPSDEEEEYRNPGEPGDQERGLLTDIPLVLGPQEIEALPMLIQIGICAGQGAIMHGRDMQGMRCNILLAGEPGRNLLRELLIFIAAWDLQDDEMYFKLMMQIMEAILENGLMPYAYQTFAEVKDIVSPAQSMVIKILTQIFRGKQGLPPTGKAAWTAANVHADASRRVNIYIVRYIFTIFRQCIIPETCALIYLQGQIKAGHASPEDFPLNLWDMERVYEGVYQFLEFFAVLTESDEWKDLLVNWEIVSELVTLLRELEASIPKSSLNTVPQTAAEAQQALMQQAATQRAQQAALLTSSVPTPVTVERPFDIASPQSTVEASADLLPAPVTETPFPDPSPPSQTSSQDPDGLDAADPSDFEWRNLKKLVILVLSSLVWKSSKVQKQINQYGGVEMVVACCQYDGNNPYIREHAVMCLRFLVEGSEENKELVRKIERGKPEGAVNGSPSELKVKETEVRIQSTGHVEEQEES